MNRQKSTRQVHPQAVEMDGACGRLMLAVGIGMGGGLGGGTTLKFKTISRPQFSQV